MKKRLQVAAPILMRMCEKVSSNVLKIETIGLKFYTIKKTPGGAHAGCFNFEWLPTVKNCLYLQLNKNATAKTQYSIRNGVICTVSVQITTIAN